MATDVAYKEMFDFVVRLKNNSLRLERKNTNKCYCPYSYQEDLCSSHCPHFVVDNCNIADKRCNLILTCGKHIQRTVEIIS